MSCNNEDIIGYLDALIKYKNSWNPLSQKPDINCDIDIETNKKINIFFGFNESDPNQYKMIIKLAVLQAIGILTTKAPDNYKDELKKMVEHCIKWDREYNYNAIDLFPELKNIFVENGYKNI